jgi:hypothetical protein
MTIDSDTLKKLIERELEYLSDARVTAHVRGLLVEPKVVMRGWDYGTPGEEYPCWQILSDDGSDFGIAYCEFGFGPRNPWGLVGSLGGDPGSMGMDSAWFPTLLDAYFESSAATLLPIWRVFRTGSSGIREAITDENSWETTWKQVYESREVDPASRYDCDHAIAYKHQ